MKDVLLDIPRTAMEVFEILPEGTLCEVIDNALYMSPSPTTNHQRILLKISSRLEVFLNQLSLGEIFIAPCDVYLNVGGENVVQPDLLFVKESRRSIIEKRGIFGPPDFVIEILSNNLKFDKETKLNLYERNAIPEYFIIDPETKEVWHYLLANDAYTVQADSMAGQLNIKSLDLKITF